MFKNSIVKAKNLPFKDRLKSVWHGMRQRCYNKKSKAYRFYGARGIRICREWHDFANYYRWAVSNGYSPGLQIDRIDSDGWYSPENCRFVTPRENIKNRRKSPAKQLKMFLKAWGERKYISEWAKDPRCAVSEATLRGRLLRNGWMRGAAEKLISRPNQLSPEHRRKLSLAMSQKHKNSQEAL